LPIWYLNINIFKYCPTLHNACLSGSNSTYNRWTNLHSDLWHVPGNTWQSTCRWESVWMERARWTRRWISHCWVRESSLQGLGVYFRRSPHQPMLFMVCTYTLSLLEVLLSFIHSFLYCLSQAIDHRWHRNTIKQTDYSNSNADGFDLTHAKYTGNWELLEKKQNVAILIVKLCLILLLVLVYDAAIKPKLDNACNCKY